MTSDNQSRKQDWTIKLENFSNEVRDQFKKWCETNCREWCFQFEEGSLTHMKHIQARIVLKEKTRIPQIGGHLKSILKAPMARGSMTAKVNWSNYDYVTKDHTRVDGPWRYNDPDEKIYADVKDLVLVPWQQMLLDYIMSPVHPREIMTIVDLIGRHGKSTFIKWLRYKKLAIQIMATSRIEDATACVFAKNKQHCNCYIFDIQRSVTKKELDALWASVERIKNGVIAEARNTYRDVEIPAPHIIVFLNQMPNEAHLSDDRWQIIDISNEEQLNTTVTRFDGKARLEMYKRQKRQMCESKCGLAEEKAPSTSLAALADG